MLQGLQNRLLQVVAPTLDTADWISPVSMWAVGGSPKRVPEGRGVAPTAWSLVEGRQLRSESTKKSERTSSRLRDGRAESCMPISASPATAQLKLGRRERMSIMMARIGGGYETPAP